MQHLGLLFFARCHLFHLKLVSPCRQRICLSLGDKLAVLGYGDYLRYYERGRYLGNFTGTDTSFSPLCSISKTTASQLLGLHELQQFIDSR